MMISETSNPTLTHAGADEPGSLNPALLIASAINTQGNIDLCAVEDGRARRGARVELCLDGQGRILQRRYWADASDPSGRIDSVRRGRSEPLDMMLLAAGLEHVFGPATPPLFRLTRRSGNGPRQLAHPGKECDRERMRILHDAFAIQLLAYEERLV